MICDQLNRDLQLGFLFRMVLGFLDRTISGAMGCFIGCFRTGDDRRFPSSSALVYPQSSRYSPKEAAISGNHLSSLSLVKDKEDSPLKDYGDHSLGSPVIDKGLKDEATFLKACGTLARTPAEIWKVSQKLEASPSNGSGSESSKFHSWLPETSIENLPLDIGICQFPSPVIFSEIQGAASDVLEQTRKSGISNAQNTGWLSTEASQGSGTRSAHTAEKIDASQTGNIDTPLPCHTKSVRFDVDTDISSSGSSSVTLNHSMRKIGKPGNQRANDTFVYPTPQKLSDAMQTPGTVCPTPLENLTSGKPRVRSQFVCSVYNPVEDDFQWKVLQEEDFDKQYSGEMRDSFEQPPIATPMSVMGEKEISSESEMKLEASLSAWLKPQACTLEVNAPFPATTPGPEERPIIGIVATHWNKETSQNSPKWWDGNGIPNTITKYKEDQKVSWHATPFEERLEKALTQGCLIARKHSHGKPIVFNENEEGGTAVLSSNLQQPI